MRNVVVLVLAVVVGAGCVRMVPVASRIEAGAFKACQLDTGMSQAELVEECGEPAEKLRSLNEDESECWLYETRTLFMINLSSTAFAGARGAYALCFEERTKMGTKTARVASIWAVSTASTAVGAMARLPL